ncbi:uncharacterized protein LOC132306669 isoform X2 [Cornus florida]|uniref:uncharacterized protein LOC132306669 isoform X2 n=1 Tax=Cornus florida TaxID=4283 RepID=UPI002897824F|nr:uncharacterized protein LOC132306669 isoform X2 [Cornus florida]
MSTRGSNGPPLRGYVRNPRRRRTVLAVDLNALPSENQDQDGTSAHAGSQDVQAGQQGGSVQPATIDVEAFDDDVLISSPRSFEEAKNNSTRNRGRTVVVDVDSGELTPSGRNLRRRVSSNQTIINCELYVNLEGSNNSKDLALHGLQHVVLIQNALLDYEGNGTMVSECLSKFDLIGADNFCS